MKMIYVHRDGGGGGLHYVSRIPLAGTYYQGELVRAAYPPCHPSYIDAYVDLRSPPETLQ